MGPLAAVPAVSIAAVLGLLIARRLRSGSVGSRTLPLALIVAVTALQAAMTTTRVHLAAIALLAAGVGLQSARIATSRPRGTLRFVRWSTVAMLACSVVGGITWNALALRRGDRRVASGGQAAGPNVILLILDTVRADRLSVYGYHRPTSPALSALAARGIRFDHALATAPWTLPSHATMFTGRYPQELNVGWDRPLDATYPTLAEQLSRRGYQTAGFVANTFYGSYLHGLSRGFGTYEDYPVSVSEVFGASNINRRLLSVWNRTTGQYHEIGRKDAAAINRQILGWLDSRSPDQPFFVFANYFDAHMPYLPPAPFDTLYLGREPRSRSVYQGERGKPSAETIADLSDAYDGALTWLDTQLGALFAELTARGLTENTVIIVSSDHGESFGEHGFLDHGSSLFLPELHVPLLIAFPDGRASGCVVTPWVTLRDLSATIWAITHGTGDVFPGRSLLQFCDTSFGDDAAATSAVYAENDQRAHLPGWYPASGRALQSLISDDYQLIQGSDGISQLYQTANDYAERQDVAQRPDLATRLARMRQQLNDVARAGRSDPQ
jgi:arylsulfatase A-like enzyme